MKFSNFIIIKKLLFVLSFSNIYTQAFEKLKYNLVEELPNIYINPLSEKIGHTWSNGVVWDKKLINKFYNLIPKTENVVILDLGAQTGSFSLLAKYLPKSVWYSFEPIKEVAEVLKENLVINNILNVKVYPSAVTDHVGKTKLFMAEMNAWGLTTIGSNTLRFSPISTREVECVTLDYFVLVNKIEKVDFIKIDTEGAELSILKGAKGLIMRDRPIILMEYNETNMHQCYVFKEQIDNYLEQMGYKWDLISNEDILCTPK